MDCSPSAPSSVIVIGAGISGTAAEFDKVFAQGQLPKEIREVVINDPTISVKQLLLTCNLVKTGGEAKRMIAQGAVTIDGQKVSDPNAPANVVSGQVVRLGKLKFVQIKIK